MIAAIYARKSTEQAVSDDQKSIARQVDHARQYALRKGWRLDEACIFTDDGISGAEFTRRPGFLRLMNSLKPRPLFQVLIMSEESRLGREAIETAYALKQLVQAGVRVFFYLEDRERTLDSPTDKIMLSLTAFADELEREKARQRTYDAMQRKARAGHVTGGTCFGYRNVEVTGPDGQRSHVTRVVDQAEAAVVREIFRLSAAGHGFKAIAIALNTAGAVSPRAQRGRSRSWAPSSVREVLFRPLYRGEIVWNQTRKRNQWGAKAVTARAAQEWIKVPAPELRIVSDAEWEAAHARLAAARSVYLAGTGGRAHGRPALGSASRYLLTNLASCGVCGGPMKVRTRRHGNGRKHFYGCSWHHERGPVCANGADVPMEAADGEVIGVLLDEVLDREMLADAVDAAVRLLRDDSGEAQIATLDRTIAAVSQERDRYVAAIGAGGDLVGLVAALRAREERLRQLEAERAALRTRKGVSALEVARVRQQLHELAGEWRRVLVDSPAHARPIVTRLLNGRAVFTPVAKHEWQLAGEGTLTGLFSAVISRGVASPPGFDASGIALLRRFAA